MAAEPGTERGQEQCEQLKRQLNSSHISNSEYGLAQRKRTPQSHRQETFAHRFRYSSMALHLRGMVDQGGGGEWERQDIQPKAARMAYQALLPQGTDTGPLRMGPGTAPSR